MKIDMHCHVSQGSADSKVGIEKYISILIEKGFQGMLVTDHNSYNGYRYWKKYLKDKKFKDFVVLKGIEYDTSDAGHILIVMPDGVKRRLLETRGMPLKMLIQFVHKNGGILGPAHPCGEKYMSYTRANSFYKMPELIKRFDFIEVYNSCEPLQSNEEAEKLAIKYKKARIGGSDAHNSVCVGMGYTEFEEEITTELDLIAAIRNSSATKCEGQIYNKTTKDKLGKAKSIMSVLFWLYNKVGNLYKLYSRKNKEKVEHLIDPIDPIELEYLGTKENKKKLHRKRR